MKFKNRQVLITSLLVLLFTLASSPGHHGQARGQHAKPNIVILLADDLGYGDLGSYGHPTIKTPNIDKLGEQGVRFTSFVTGSKCVPSRTQLLTGRYMPRVDFGGKTGAHGTGGLPGSELTLAEALKQAGYHTGMAGKWHLGYAKEAYLPPNQGFDSWLGLPYSHDNRKPWVNTKVPLRMYRDLERLEEPVNISAITAQYTEEAVNFISSHAGRDQPFFFYLAYSMPHLPIHGTEELPGNSSTGLYSDVVETIDRSVGRVLETLQNEGVAENTIVFFSSDNGPWLNLPKHMRRGGIRSWHQGTAGHLRESKSTTYEGGARVPALIRWPAEIPGHRVTAELAASPDIFRTLVEVAGASLPDNQVDGYNMLPLLTGEENASPRSEYLYILRNRLEAMRRGPWKLRLASRKPQLFHLVSDPGERFNRAQEFPDIVREIRQAMILRAKELGISIP